MSGHVTDKQLSLLVDGELTAASRAAVLAHVGLCVDCAERYEALVNATAALQLAPALQWTAELTTATLARVHSRRHHALSLPIASMLALAGVVLVVVHLGAVRAGFSVSRAAFETLSSLAPAPFGASGLSLLATLLGLAFFSPLLAYRLLRWR